MDDRSKAIYLGRFGLTFRGPDGGQFSQPTRDARDAVESAFALAESMGVVISLPGPGPSTAENVADHHSASAADAIRKAGGVNTMTAEVARARERCVSVCRNIAQTIEDHGSDTDRITANRLMMTNAAADAGDTLLAAEGGEQAQTDGDARV